MQLRRRIVIVVSKISIFSFPNKNWMNYNNTVTLGGVEIRG
jgi:hypothetical protein